MAKKNVEDYPEIKSILDRLSGGKPHELIVLFVPSHDRKDKEIPDQLIWADSALALFGKLYRRYGVQIS